MKKVARIFVAASLLMNLIALILGRGSAMHFIAVLALDIYIGLPALILAACLLSLRNRRQLGQLFGLCLVLGSFVVSLSISLIPGYVVVKHDIWVAKVYCEQIVADVEAHKEKYGTYPESIPNLPPDAPYLAQSPQYWSNGSAFNISIPNPQTLSNGYMYDSENHAWSEWD